MPEDISPVVKLPKEQVAELENSEKVMKSIEKSLKALKEMGMDVSVIEEKMQWAKTVKDTLLKEFT